ncbi:MFS transporter [Brevibacillus sp. TJ4]|uniref:MFS transporter n=1 Tax=Brevibacillus sp. TJ4 TaxID=3234853 RepID=UPI0037D73413
MQEDKKLDLISIASIPLIMTLGNSMLIPILPTIQKKLAISSLQVSLIITVYSAVAIVLIPIAGYLSDRYGRKNIIIPSLITTAAGGAISGFAAWFIEDSYWLILLGRFFQGIGAAGSAPIVMPLVGDMFHRDDDVSSGLGVIETANTLGKVLSPILGAALATVLWYLPFLAIPVFCLISIVLVMFLLKAPKKQEKPKQFRHFLTNVKDIFKQKGRWLYAIFAIGCICMFVVFGVLFYLSSMLEDRYGIDGVYKGLILAIPLGMLCTASFLTGKLIGKNKRLMKWVTFFALLVLSVSVFLTGWVTGLPLTILGLVFSGLGIGASLPCLDAFITEGIEKGERGTITSIYSSMRFIGVAAAPPIVSLLMEQSRMALFLTFTSVSLVAAILSLLAIRPSQKTREDDREKMVKQVIHDLFGEKNLERLK